MEHKRQPGLYRPFVKRWLDLALATPASVLLLPALLILGSLIRIRLGGPVLFRQTRPGLNGHPFELFKFRTMTGECNAEGRLLPDERRLTPFGRLLRQTSLDELPELLNVLRGDMSLVGPRPLLMAYLDRYTPAQARRHEVRPGITGLAQVSGRNLLSWDDRFACDVWYVDHCSFPVDAKILWQTLWKVVAREGISQPGRATAEEFRGSGGGSAPGRSAP